MRSLMRWACWSERERPEPSGLPRAAAGQGGQALGGVGGPPAADGFVADAQQVSEFHLGVAQFDAAQGTQAQHLKGFIGQMAGVWQLDGHDGSPSWVFSSSCFPQEHY